MQAWEFIATESSQDLGIFKTRVDLLRSPRNQAVLRRVIVEPPDWVNVVARTTAGRYLMVKQVRHGIGQVSLEIPAGAVDPGETAEQAALRELREETGHAPQQLIPLGQVRPNPAFQSNRCSFFLAEGCQKVGEPELDEGEDLQLEEWDWPELQQACRDGRIHHSLVIAAFYYLRDGGYAA